MKKYLLALLMISACATTKPVHNKSMQVTLLDWKYIGRNRAQLTTLNNKGDTLYLFYGWQGKVRFEKGMKLTVEYDSTQTRKNALQEARIRVNY